MTTQPTTETTAVAPAPLRPVPTGYAAPVQACPAELFDGWAMHSAALHRSMTTLLFPGQAMMAYYGDDHTTGAAFAHSVPNQTWLSSATLLQDKRVRRDVLEAAGVPVPRGRAFGLKRGLPFAREFAEEIGYPVVVKPMIGESTVEVIPAVEDERQLDHAVEYLRTVPTLRPDFTTSSYAFTQILTPKTGSSTRTRSTYRSLVEESNRAGSPDDGTGHDTGDRISRGDCQVCAQCARSHGRPIDVGVDLRDSVPAERRLDRRRSHILPQWDGGRSLEDPLCEGQWQCIRRCAMQMEPRPF